MGSHEADLQLRAAMASHGANMTKPAHTIHYLYLKSRASADAAAAQLRAAGYQNLRVELAPITSIWQRLFGSKQFSCIAETYAMPSQAAVFATTDQMDGLASRFGGEYDGWEASIEKQPCPSRGRSA